MKPAFERIKDAVREKDSLLCVGLDPSDASVKKFFSNHPLKRGKPAEDAETFCRFLIDETKDLVCCFKPNSAFFEALGPEGFNALKNVCDYVHSLGVPIILDAKRGDIGSTASAYASAAYGIFNATIVTVNPYLGVDSLTPFVEPYPDRGIFALCRTSNLGSKCLQERLVGNNEFLYEAVANMCQQSKTLAASTGLVIGATQPEAIQHIRQRYPEVWFLSPGIGAQQADLVQCLEAGLQNNGYGMILPVSRAIAEAENPREAAEHMRNTINKIRRNFVTDKEMTQRFLSLH